MDQQQQTKIIASYLPVSGLILSFGVRLTMVRSSRNVPTIVSARPTSMIGTKIERKKKLLRKMLTASASNDDGDDDDDNDDI